MRLQVAAEILPASVYIRSAYDEEFSVDVTNEMRFVGSKWIVRDLEVGTILPEGDGYFIDMNFYSDGLSTRSTSDEFTVYYDLSISEPKITYDREHDLLTVSDIVVYSAFNNGVMLESADMNLTQIVVCNSSTGNVLDIVDLYYLNGQFFRDIPLALQRYGEGEIFFVLVISTRFSGEYSFIQPEIMISPPEDIGGSNIPDASGGDDDRGRQNLGRRRPCIPERP